MMPYTHQPSLPRATKQNVDWYEAHWKQMELVKRVRQVPACSLPFTQPGRSLSTPAATVPMPTGLQRAADLRDARGMYMGIKKATGPTPIKSAPLKSKSGATTTDQGKPLERWVEHYLELYATQNVITITALYAIPVLPIMDELDWSPTIE